MPVTVPLVALLMVQSSVVRPVWKRPGGDLHGVAEP